MSHQVGTRKVPLKLIKNYWKQRKQIVKINEEPSGEEILENGVHQGSVLDPLLFNFYI